jgi:hypothetical protein
LIYVGIEESGNFNPLCERRKFLLDEGLVKNSQFEKNFFKLHGRKSNIQQR